MMRLTTVAVKRVLGPCGLAVTCGRQASNYTDCGDISHRLIKKSTSSINDRF
jgi:hypothetical protein